MRPLSARHNTLAAGMLVGGAGCLCCSFVPPGVASAAFAAIGKFGCAGAFTVASIFTSELFPTLVRCWVPRRCWVPQQCLLAKK